jgi:hypothetical protein
MQGRPKERPDNTTKVNEELARTRHELAQMKERQSLFEQQFAQFMRQQHVTQTVPSPLKSESPTAAERPKTSRRIQHPSPQQFADYVAPSPTSVAGKLKHNQTERAEFGQLDPGEVSDTSTRYTLGEDGTESENEDRVAQMRFERIRQKQQKQQAKERALPKRDADAIDPDFHVLVKEFEEEMRATQRASAPPKTPPVAWEGSEEGGNADSVQEQKESVHRRIRELMERGDAYADFMSRLCHEVAALPLESHYVRAECLGFFQGVRRKHRQQSKRKVEMSSPAGVALLSTADVRESVETLGGDDATDLDTEVETEADDEGYSESVDGGHSESARSVDYSESVDGGYSESIQSVEYREAVDGEYSESAAGGYTDSDSVTSSRVMITEYEDRSEYEDQPEQMSSDASTQSHTTDTSSQSHTNYFIQNLAGNPLVSPNMKGQQMRAQQMKDGTYTGPPSFGFNSRDTGIASSAGSTAGSSGIVRGLGGYGDDDTGDDDDRTTGEDGNEFEGFTSEVSSYSFTSYAVEGSQRDDDDFEDDRSQNTDAEWRNIYEPSDRTEEEFTAGEDDDDDDEDDDFTAGEFTGDDEDEDDETREGRYDYAESLGTSNDTAMSVPTSAMDEDEEDAEFGFDSGSIGGGAYEADSDIGVTRGMYDADSDTGDGGSVGQGLGRGRKWNGDYDTSSVGGTDFTDTSGGLAVEDGDYDEFSDDDIKVEDDFIDTTTFSDTVTGTDTSGDADSETVRRRERRITPMDDYDRERTDSEYGMEDSQVAPEPKGRMDLQVADESMLPPAHRTTVLERRDSEFGMEAFQVADEWMLQRPGTNTWPPTRARDLQVADESMLPPSHREGMLRQRTDEFGLEAFQIADESMLDAGRLQENADITSSSCNSVSSAGDDRVPQYVLKQQQAMAAGRPQTARGRRQGAGAGAGAPISQQRQSIDSEFGLEDFQVSDEPRSRTSPEARVYDECISVASSEQNVDAAAVVVPLDVASQQQEQQQQQRMQRRRQRHAEAAAALNASAGSGAAGSPRSSPLQPVVHLLQRLIDQMTDESGPDALFDKEMLLNACDQVVSALRRVLLGIESETEDDTEDEHPAGARKMMVDHHLRSTLRRAFLKFRARPIMLAKRELVQRASDILHDEMTFASVLNKLDLSFENEIATLRRSARARSASAAALRSSERKLLQQRQDAVEELLLERQQRLGRADDYAQPRSTPITKQEREQIRSRQPISPLSNDAEDKRGFRQGRGGEEQEDGGWAYPQDEASSSEPEETQPSEVSDSDEFDYFETHPVDSAHPDDEKNKKLDQSVETFRQLRQNFQQKMDQLTHMAGKRPKNATQDFSQSAPVSSPPKDGNYKDFKQIFGFSPAVFNKSTGSRAQPDDRERVGVESLSAPRVQRGSPRNGASGDQALSPSAAKYIVYGDGDGDDDDDDDDDEQAAGAGADEDGFTDLGMLGMEEGGDEEKVDILGMSGDGMAAQMQGMLQQMQEMILQQQQLEAANAFGGDEEDGGAITMNDLPTSAERAQRQKQERRSPAAVAATRQQLMQGLQGMVQSASAKKAAASGAHKWEGAASAPAFGVQGIGAALSSVDEQATREMGEAEWRKLVALKVAKANGSANGKANGKGGGHQNGAGSGMSAGGVLELGASQTSELKHQFDSEQVSNSERA